MRTTIHLILAVLLLTACGTMQESVQVRDDVYDIPDRTLVTSAARAPETSTQGQADDYYDSGEAQNYQQGSYYDRTYNDPTWYNRDRFGFGYNSSPWGNSWSMGYGMGLGHNTMFNSPNGFYDPYWGNSWQSGYGYYNPWNSGMYAPMGWNSGWGNGFGCGYGWGMNNCNGWGNSWFGGGHGFYPGANYYGHGGWGGWGGGSDLSQSIIVRPRPSMSGGGATGGADVNVIPRSSRFNNDISLMRPTTQGRQKVPVERRDITRPKQLERDRNRIPAPGTMNRDRQQPDRKMREERPSRTRERTRDSSPSFDRGGGGGGNSGGGGRGGGGGSTPSPRPRR